MPAAPTDDCRSRRRRPGSTVLHRPVDPDACRIRVRNHPTGLALTELRFEPRRVRIVRALKNLKVNAKTATSVAKSSSAWPRTWLHRGKAVMNQDLPIIIGGRAVTSTAAVSASLLVDTGYALLDPHVR